MAEASVRTRTVNVKNEDFDVYIGRAMPGFVASRFANRHRIGPGCTRAQALQLYRQDIERWRDTDPSFAAELEKLRGKRLGCWCKPLDCHGDILVEVLEGPQEPLTPVQGALF